MPIADWVHSEDWDTLYLGGQRVPGIVRVKCSAKSGIDTRKPRGGKKAAQKDNGAPPKTLHVEVDLNHEQLSEFEATIIPLLDPRAVFAARDPLEIAHPEARLWGIYVVIPGEIDSEHPESGGLKTIGFELEEWAPEAKAVKKSADKPKDNHGENWNVQPKIDALRPARANAARQNLFAPTS